MTSPWADRRFVFVGGMHRSGTTYVADVLREVPGVASLTDTGVRENEGQHLQDVYPADWKMGGSTKWTRDPRFHLVEADADRVHDAAQRLWTAWAPYVAPAEAATIVEKTPGNLTKTRFLQRIFPNSSFVVVTRHPVTQALAQCKWMDSRSGRLGQQLLSLIEQWVRAHQAFREDQRLIDHSMVLRFEDMVANPGESAQRLLDFLALPPISGKVSAMDPDRVREYERRWARGNQPGQLLRAVRALPSGVGRHTLAVRDFSDALAFPRTLRVARRKFGPAIAELGYDLEVLDRARPWEAAG